MPVEQDPLTRWQTQSSARPLVLPIIYGLAAKLSETSLHNYLTDANTMAYCQRIAAQRFDYDAVYVYADNAIDVEALGADIEWPSEMYPRVRRPLLLDPADFQKHLPAEPGSAGRRAIMLEACQILRQKLGQEKLIVGTVFGPFSLSAQLLGLEELLFLAVDEPVRCQILLEQATEFMESYALELMKSGVDILMLYEPAASPAVVSGSMFQMLLQPVFAKILRTWSKQGMKTWLNIVGPIRPFLNYLPALNADFVTVDDSIDWASYRRILPNSILVGNLSAPLLAVENSSQLAIRMQETYQGADRGIFTGADCEFPLDTKPENVEVFVLRGKQRGG